MVGSRRGVGVSVLLGPGGSGAVRESKLLRQASQASQKASVAPRKPLALLLGT